MLKNHKPHNKRHKEVNMPFTRTTKSLLDNSTTIYRTFDNVYNVEILAPPAGQLGPGAASYANPFAGLTVAVTAGFGFRRFTDPSWSCWLRKCHAHNALDIKYLPNNQFIKAPEPGRAYQMKVGEQTPDGHSVTWLSGDHSIPTVVLIAASGNKHYFMHQNGTGPLGQGDGKAVVAGEPICTSAPWYGGTHVHYIFVKAGTTSPTDVFINFFDDPIVKAASPEIAALADALRPTYNTHKPGPCVDDPEVKCP